MSLDTFGTTGGPIPSIARASDWNSNNIMGQNTNWWGGYNDNPNNSVLGDMFGGVGDWDSMSGWGNALNGIGGIAQAWLGYGNLQLNEEKFNTSKDIWNAEREANRIVTNTDIMDRQASRLSSTGNSNASGNYNSMNYTRNNSTIPKVTV